LFHQAFKNIAAFIGLLALQKRFAATTSTLKPGSPTSSRNFPIIGRSGSTNCCRGVGRQAHDDVGQCLGTTMRDWRAVESTRTADRDGRPEALELCTSHGVIAPVSIPMRASSPAWRRTDRRFVLEPRGTGPAIVCNRHCRRLKWPSSSAKRPIQQSGSSMNLRRCESLGNAARIAVLSADQAPTAIIGCPHMTTPDNVAHKQRLRQSVPL
jgi:hypothetical protein